MRSEKNEESSVPPPLKKKKTINLVFLEVEQKKHCRILLDQKPKRELNMQKT